MKKVINFLVIITFFFLLTLNVNAKEEDIITMYVFKGDGCPHCAAELKYLDTIKDNYKNLKIVELDDGAIVTKILDKVHFDNVVGVVELTEMGLRRIRPNEKDLLYPVLNVAKTKLKR